MGVLVKKMEQEVIDIMLLDSIDVEVPAVDELQLGWEELLQPVMTMVTACGTSDKYHIGRFTTVSKRQQPVHSCSRSEL